MKDKILGAILVSMVVGGMTSSALTMFVIEPNAMLLVVVACIVILGISLNSRIKEILKLIPTDKPKRDEG